GHDDEVRPLRLRDVDELAEYGDVLGQPRLSFEDLPDVPVGGVQQLHQNGMSSSDSDAPAVRAPTTANASAAWVNDRSVARGGGPASAGRVAQAGKGNSTTSGTGSSGWLTNMVPGLAISARARWAGGRKPYSGRPASAGSSRPTTRIAELATMRRSTSLAVCCAPISTTPSDRP